MSDFRVTMADVVEMMDGHEQPPEGPQRDAYWQLWLKRAEATFTDDQMGELFLLAGTGPDELFDWQQSYDRRRRNRAVPQ